MDKYLVADQETWDLWSGRVKAKGETWYDRHKHTDDLMSLIQQDQPVTLSIDTVDNVTKPPHYNQGKIETIDYLKDSMPVGAYVGYLEGNVKKYVARWRYKAGVEDLKKAQWYLDRLIKELDGQA